MTTIRPTSVSWYPHLRTGRFRCSKVLLSTCLCLDCPCSPVVSPLVCHVQSSITRTVATVRSSIRAVAR